MKVNLLASIWLAAAFCVVTCEAAGKETVAVIGTGDMGDTLGPRFAELGYRVVYGSRDPQGEKVKALVARTGAAASAATAVEAAAHGLLGRCGLAAAQPVGKRREPGAQARREAPPH